MEKLNPGDRIYVPDYKDNTLWFNEDRTSTNVVVGPQLRPNAVTSMVSPRTIKNMVIKRDATRAIEQVLGRAIPANLHPIAAALLTQIGGALDSPDLTCAAMTRALSDVDVVDPVFAEAFFNKLDVHRTGRVPITTVMSIADICINSDIYKGIVRRHCFDLLQRNGFIHCADLESYRVVSGKDNAFRNIGATADMVRVLGDVIIAARRAEEEEYINEVLLKKSKKKKKKAPPLKPNQKSHIPPNLARISHIDYDMFSRYFDTNKELATAFLPRWLNFMMTDARLNRACVMRAISLLEDAAEERQQQQDAEDASGAIETK